MIDHADQLARLADESQLEITQIRELFERLNAPSSLTRLRLVLKNLHQALNAGRDLHDGLFSGMEIEIPIFVVEKLCKTLDQLSDEQSFLPADWLDESREPRGIIKAHPEWAMLIIGQANLARRQEEFLQHLYIVLFSAIHQRSRHAIIGSEVDTGCRVIRKLATGKISSSTLFSVRPGDTLADYLSKLGRQSEPTQEDWAGVELLTRKILEDRGKTRFSSGYRRSGSVVRNIVRRDSDELTTEGPDAELHVYQAMGSKEEQDIARATGLHPGEAEELQATAVIYSPAAPTVHFSTRDHIRRQANQVKHLRSLNQRLPFRYQQLTSLELASAASLPFQLINNMAERGSRISRRLDDYVAILLHLLLWLGRPLDQLLELRIYTSIDEAPRSDEGLVAYIREEDGFVLSIPSSKWRRRLSENDRFLLENIGGATGTASGGRIVVKSPVRFQRYINTLEKNKGQPGNNRRHYLFPPKLQDSIVTRLKRVIAEKNREEDLRLTPLRISQAMFDEISMLTTDWVDASLLTGQTFTTTEVSAHYYTVSGTYLEQVYHQAAASLRERLYSYLKIPRNKGQEITQDYPNLGDHGSKLNVKPQLVKELVKHFKHQLRSAVRNSTGVAEVHNAFVVYIAFWILFSTGYRAVNDLIFRINEVDWKSGFIVISDKDNNDQSNSRIAWLPPTLLKQVRLYMEHLAVLQTKVPYGTTLWNSIDQLRRAPNPDAALMFFIRDENSIARLTPESLRAQVEGLSLPLNIGRHYLRPRLRQHGCHAEYVNVFLGHWQHGQEPFGRYSSLTPIEMYSNIAPYLEQLRKESGWTVQNGFANG